MSSQQSSAPEMPLKMLQIYAPRRDTHIHTHNYNIIIHV